MSENLRTYTKALFMLDAVASRVPPEAWDNPSCCEGWTAREVAGHAAWTIKNVGSLAAGKGYIVEQPEAEVLGDDPAATMRAIVTGALAQLDRAGSLARVVPTGSGETAVDDFLGLVWVDALIHAWDVADATGTAHGIDPDTAQEAHDRWVAVIDDRRGPGQFDEAREATDDDPVSKLIALTGRTSVRGGGEA